MNDPRAAGRFDPDNRGEGVLLIYTGGTIGSMPSDPEDPDSPRVAIPWEEFRRRTPALNRTLADGSPNPSWIGFNVDAWWTEPRDSCNVGPAEWVELARVIESCHDRYQGFVILHGTDTMAYTASALSFMLPGLDRPVILTGAQRSHLFNARNDATQNLISALMLANPGFSRVPVIPEVTIFFNRTLLRGNRARKVNATGYDAYQSPSFPPLAVAGERIEADPLLLRPRPGPGRLRVRTALEPNVVPVSFFPGIQDGKLLEGILDDPRLRGVVLLAYGAGNIPTRPSVLEAIRRATARGVVAMAVTQCGGGRVELGMYETSVKLIDAGVVTGVDITPEAALTKLMVLLGDDDLGPAEVARLAQQNLCGEMSLGVYVTRLEQPGTVRLDAARPRHRFAARRFEGLDGRAGEVEELVLRLRKAECRTGGGRLAIRLFADLGPDEPADPGSDRLVGEFGRRPTDPAEPGRTMFFVITRAAHKLAGDRVSLTVALDTDDPAAVLTWESAEVAAFRPA
ncbi:asparaginase [candidate division WOR-3 bacterium]|nr:asparaginase [candidate division WOR-3 bacterium]